VLPPARHAPTAASVSSPAEAVSFLSDSTKQIQILGDINQSRKFADNANVQYYCTLNFLSKKREPTVLTEADEQAQRHEYVLNYARAQARQELAQTHAAELVDDGMQWRFEVLLQRCDKDAAEIAREMAEETVGQVRSAPGAAAYEAAFVEGYTDALLALVASEMARCDRGRIKHEE
jgi:hypothetical protein